MILVLSQSGPKGKNRLLADDCIRLLEHFTNDEGTSIVYRNFNDDDIQYQLEKSEKIVMVIPEWNASIPYTLKKTIDESGWPSSLKNKTIGLIGTSGGHGGNMLGVSHLSDILHYVGADINKHKVYVPYVNEDKKKDNDIGTLILELMKDICLTTTIN